MEGGVFFVVWKGWGIVVIGIAVLAVLIGAGVGAALGIEGQNGDYPVGLALLVAGVGTWFLGIRMNRNADRHLVDPATGETVIVRGGHDLFFVPVRWWGLVMIGAGALLIVNGVVGTIQG
jgi:hypothetical protein